MCLFSENFQQSSRVHLFRLFPAENAPCYRFAVIYASSESITVFHRENKMMHNWLHRNLKLSFWSTGPSGVLKQSGEKPFHREMWKTYQLIRWGQTQCTRWFTLSSSMSPGLSLFPPGLIWTQIASVKAQPGSSLRRPSYCSNIKEPGLHCCTVSSDSNAPIIPNSYYITICQPAEGRLVF